MSQENGKPFKFRALKQVSTLFVPQRSFGLVSLLAFSKARENVCIMRPFVICFLYMIFLEA